MSHLSVSYKTNQTMKKVRLIVWKIKYLFLLYLTVQYE